MNNSSHMKIQKSGIFLKKNLTINVRKIKKYCKVRDNFHYTEKYKGAGYNICNLKFSVPNKNTIAVHNVYN